jgi:hypothetical protein
MEAKRQLIGENTKQDTLQKAIESLAKQQEICDCLTVLLSHIVSDFAGTIKIDQFSALAGSVDILEAVSKELESVYTILDEL